MSAGFGTSDDLRALFGVARRSTRQWIADVGLAVVGRFAYSFLIWLLLLPLIAVLLVIALLLVLRFTDAGPGLRRLLGAAGGSTRPVAATLAPGPSPAPPPRAASATRSQR